ncbi:MAG: tetratricopeptide repeat protein [Magnetococcales bacterium]|nr:tetratricopeptide repeat protein [Magnetococcales bacterium]
MILPHVRTLAWGVSVGAVTGLLFWAPVTGAEMVDPKIGIGSGPRVEKLPPRVGGRESRALTAEPTPEVADAPAERLEPREVAEEQLPNFGGDEVGFYPPLALTKRVVGQGSNHLNPHTAPNLTLFLAEWALNSGAALRNPEWLRIKAGALIVLERYSEALDVMENLPPFLFKEDPLLTLQLAHVYLVNGNFKQAQDHFSRFLLLHPQNFQVKEAEKGMVMTVLAAGELDQAELLFNMMTETSDKRIRNDPDLTAAMGRFHYRKGRRGEAERWLKILTSYPPPGAFDRRRQWRRDVAELTILLGNWSKGMSILEELLAEYPGPATLALHSRLMDSAPPNAPCGPKENIPGERLFWLRLLRDTQADVLEREIALKILLETEIQKPLGLVRPEGVLAPEKILPDLTSSDAAVLYASHAWRNHQYKEAWALLQDVPGELADAWRLAILATDFIPTEEVNPKAWIADLPNPRSPQAKIIAEPLAAAMLGFTAKMDLSEAKRIRGFLKRLPPESKDHGAIIDVLGLQAAMARELNEEPQVALTLYLELVLSGGPEGVNRHWPWYVSETPAQAVIRLLEGTGRMIEAAEFKKIWMPPASQTTCK